MKINILFYGNCQLVAVTKTLKLSSKFNIENHECFTIKLSKEDFTTIIRNADFIITQHIHDNYRDKDYLSTNYIIENKNQNTKMIIIDSLHFDFYYFDVIYHNDSNNVRVREPCDYHYSKMMECYKNRKNIQYYIDNFANNANLKSCEELEEIANNSLSELYRRYLTNKNSFENEDKNIYVITAHDYIKENYKNKLLFYSMNHPSKYTIQNVCSHLMDVFEFENNIDYMIDYEGDFLNNPKCILYKCIQKNINFDIDKYNQSIDIWNNKNINIKKATELYYLEYHKLGY
jgi:hypothetical protein